MVFGKRKTSSSFSCTDKADAVTPDNVLVVVNRVVGKNRGNIYSEICGLRNILKGRQVVEGRKGSSKD